MMADPSQFASGGCEPLGVRLCGCKMPPSLPASGIVKPAFLAARGGARQPALLAAFGLACLAVASPAATVTNEIAPPLQGRLRIHDPSTIVRCRDQFWVFGTGQGLVSRHSPDRTHWFEGPPVFAQPTAWTTNAVPGFRGSLWAPDVLALNDQYFLYYSVSTWGSQVSAIGLATNPTLDSADPAFRWTDHGPVIRSGSGDDFNAIDPALLHDVDGRLWLAFGSYWGGIKLVELDPRTGGRLSPDSPIHALAWNSSIEAAYLHRRGEYYYLFVNWGACCRGTNSTYNIRVGRSTNVAGPYLDRDGVRLSDGGGSLFLETTGRFVGPGHAGILSENGVDWVSYHYYDASNHGMPTLDLRRLGWSADGWPVLTNK